MEREDVVLEDCMLLSWEEVDTRSACIWCESDLGQTVFAESDFFLFIFHAVMAITMATMAMRKPPIAAEMMMRSGMDSEMRK